jgi:hypothetical protein
MPLPSLAHNGSRTHASLFLQDMTDGDLLLELRRCRKAGRSGSRVREGFITRIATAAAGMVNGGLYFRRQNGN